jgi:hypothetical protein
MTAEGCPVSPTQVGVWLKELDALFARRSVLPTLTPKQIKDRLTHCLDILGEDNSVDDMFNRVHIDEKNCCLMPNGEKVRIIPDADGNITYPAPPRAQHKQAIPKVMFLAANARPRPEYGFDGKIGMWRVTGLKEALKKSKNHEKGDEYEVDITMNADAYRDLMVNKVFPAIREKMWWFGRGRHATAGQQIVVQQDGARPHTAHANAAVWERERRKQGFNIFVYTQPAQSPDLNVNDCTFFRSTHARVKVLRHNNIDELAANIMLVYEEYSSADLEKCWDTLRNNVRCIVRANGQNDYRKQHRTGPKQSRAYKELTRAEVRAAKASLRRM